MATGTVESFSDAKDYRFIKPEVLEAFNVVPITGPRPGEPKTRFRVPGRPLRAPQAVAMELVRWPRSC